MMLSVWWDWRGVLYFELLPWSDYQRQEILRSIRKFEAGSCGIATGIGEQERRRLPSRQRQITHCFGDQAESREL